MITCPNCGASLPDWAKNCQFCQVNTQNVVRPVQDKPTHGAFNTPTWIWAAYYSVSAYLLISAGAEIAKILAPSKGGMNFFGPIEIVYESIVCLVAIGLLCKIGFVRGIVNFICYIGILVSLLDLASSFELIFLDGAIGVLWTFVAVLNLSVYGFMIYLIGETEKHFY
jgi:hypothetical protein